MNGLCSHTYSTLPNVISLRSAATWPDRRGIGRLALPRVDEVWVAYTSRAYFNDLNCNCDPNVHLKS
jgi:hypothetical protein